MKNNSDQAPDREVLLSNGKKQNLSELWRDNPVALIFLRHFGWPFCKQQVAQLRKEKSRLDKSGIQVVIVGMGSPAETEEFRKRFDLPFPFICDPEKKLYTAYGLKRASFQQIASPDILLKGFQAFIQGHSPGLPKGDPMQMSGEFIIDRNGRFILQHYAEDISNHLPVEAILEAVKKSS